MTRKLRDSLQESDTGIVIYDADTNQFWCNQNAWSTNLRKAEIYHAPRYVNDVIQKFPTRNLKTATVTITLNRKENTHD